MAISSSCKYLKVSLLFSTFLLLRAEDGVLQRHLAERGNFWNILGCSKIYHLLITVPGAVPAWASSEADFPFFFLYIFCILQQKWVNHLQAMLTLPDQKHYIKTGRFEGNISLNTRIINSSCVLPVAKSATQSVLLLCLLVQTFAVSEWIWNQPYTAKLKGVPVEKAPFSRWKIYKHRGLDFNG